MELTTAQIEKYNQNRPIESVSMPCWAPVRSMYLGLRGKVMTCCYNKSLGIGV